MKSVLFGLFIVSLAFLDHIKDRILPYKYGKDKKRWAFIWHQVKRFAILNVMLIFLWGNIELMPFVWLMLIAYLGQVLTYNWWWRE